MADQQPPPNKRPHSESPPLASSSKVRRPGGTTTSAAITPPDSTNGFESDSLASPKQPGNTSNSETTTAPSKSAAPAAHVSKLTFPVRPSDLIGMSLEERLKLRDPERCAEITRRNRELQQQIDDRISKMSRADWEKWCIDNSKGHCKFIWARHSVTQANTLLRVVLRKPTPFSDSFVQDVLESIHYSSGEE